LNWDGADELSFEGYLRQLKMNSHSGSYASNNIFILRKNINEIIILVLPKDITSIDENTDSYYSGLENLVKEKSRFSVQVKEASLNQRKYLFGRLNEKPQELIAAKVSKSIITVMLFFVMFGMGLTLSLKDFTNMFKKPRGMLTGIMLQWVLMPLAAVFLGHSMGFFQNNVFVFVGLVLVAASPGGVASNIYTHLAKGDLALSVSLTCMSTALSVFLTPIILVIYCSNIPEIDFPTRTIIYSIFILVLAPLILGMFMRNLNRELAEKAIPYFTALGVLAVLFLITAGLVMFFEAYQDTQRFGPVVYFSVLALVITGYLGSILISKLLKIENYQVRAISIETGVRNVAVSMTLAILIQDRIGDFFGAMLFTSGVFFLGMQMISLVLIPTYRWILPLSVENGTA